MNNVFISLGSNMGNRLQQLQSAKQQLETHVGNTQHASSIYVTAAWGNENQPDFYNQVLLVGTTLSAIALMKNILHIEQSLGRIRTEKWAQRIIDIDILFYNDEIIDLDKLHIPHPHLHERRFILQPLLEIAPNYEHPFLKKTIKELFIECTDNLPVIKLHLTDEL